MRILALVCTIILILALGLLRPPKEDLSFEKKLKEDPRDPNSLPYALEAVVAASETKYPIRKISSGDDNNLETPLNDHERHLLGKTGDSKTKRTLVKAILRLLTQDETARSDDSLFRAYVSELSGNSNEALWAIGESLSSLNGSEHFKERQALLKIAEQLPDNHGAIARIAVQELTRRQDITQEQARSPASINYEIATLSRLQSVVFLNEKQSDVLRITLDAIEAHSDSRIRAALWSQYLGRFPESKEDAQIELDSRGIQIQQN